MLLGNVFTALLWSVVAHFGIFPGRSSLGVELEDVTGSCPTTFRSLKIRVTGKIINNSLTK
jgi:hypothetical protein